MNRPSPDAGWAITGAGTVCSVADSAPGLFDALCAGRSGLAPLRGFDPALFGAQHAYEIDDPRRSAGPGLRDRPGRATELLCRAVAEAVDDAGLGQDLHGIPVLIGTGLRELRSAELWRTDGARLEADGLYFGPAMRSRFNTTASYTFTNACSASLYALGLGTDLLATGAVDTVVVAGVDVITESMFGLLDRVHPAPVDSVRPFDRNRRGVLMGDGAAAIVLRAPAHDAARTPRAWLRGIGLNCDAYHVTAPDPAGVAAAMDAAFTVAGVTPGDIDLVMAHGTGTLLNDEAEATALGKTFAARASSPLVTAVKSMTGHTSGASGLMSLVVAASSLGTGLVPPTVGLHDPVPEAEGLDFVTGTARRADLRYAQVDAFGFGGVNAVAIVERAD
ncbi:beta-ketoacyl synthase N-terminal-like domain-containing protein [Streptomyces sp. NPDC048191]|uniref:beta-ketoacyl-[acyl-carrier-protein] synthase family protein n=1 Tax=Streptomyces sp. NPDC048191 TaxID=3155484 RepID=UPI0033D63FB4